MRVAGLKSAHIYPTTIRYESRIERIVATLAARDDFQSIVIYGFSHPDLTSEERVNSKTVIHRVGSTKETRSTFRKVENFLGWYISVFKNAVKFKPDLVNCHSLSVLPLCWLIAAVTGAWLIYEPHELETETLTMMGFRQKVAKVAERLLIGRAKVVMVISQSVADAYVAAYDLDKAHVIMNAPHRIKVNSDQLEKIYFREKYAINEEALIFLYQGALSEGRGVEILLEAFARSGNNRHIVFMGFGSLQELVKQYSCDYSNIHFHSAVPAQDILRYTRGADVGIAFLEDTCVNHHFALPNKFFQYLHARIPLLVTDMEEMRTLVEQFSVGLAAKGTVDSFAKVLRERDAKFWQECQKNVDAAAEFISWDTEAIKLNNIYDELVSRFKG